MKIIFTSILAAILIFNSAFALADVSETTKNSTAIKFLKEKGIVSGYSDGTFKPANLVSRAEITKILVGATGGNPTLDIYNECFPDVQQEWFAPFVCYAKEKGWVSGYSDGTFKPANLVSKVEAIKILVRAQELELGNALDLEFVDAEKTAWYAPYLASAVKMGLLEASNGKYGIGEYISRGEIAENIYRSIILKDKGLLRFENTIESSTESKKIDDYKVVKVIDGDTVDVEQNGKKVRLRLIGIDTPETVDPRKPVQCFGKEASEMAKLLLNDKTVSLETDATQGELDSYGRMLAYIILSDGTNFNQKMIQDGYAFEYTYNKPYKYQDSFKAAQKSAREGKKGLWASDTCNGKASELNTDQIKQDLPKNSTGNNKFYTSSHHSAKFYYCQSDSQWKNLSIKYLQEFSSAGELLKSFPNRTLHEECK